MAKKIDDFFSVQAQRALVRASIFSVAQLKRLTPEELLARLNNVKADYDAVLQGLGESSLRRKKGKD